MLQVSQVCSSKGVFGGHDESTSFPPVLERVNPLGALTWVLACARRKREDFRNGRQTMKVVEYRFNPPRQNSPRETCPEERGCQINPGRYNCRCGFLL